MQITIVAGARPNFMKVCPIIKAIAKSQAENSNISYKLVHTGQHYDKNMSQVFFEELGIPDPDVNLEAGSGTQTEQTATIMTRFEKHLSENLPDVVLVVGDVTSTMACTIVAKKMGIPVVHVEAGIRSGDASMPEEINRIVTDSICDHFFTTTLVANENLIRSGVGIDRIHFVGNTMIDTLYQNLLRLRQPEIWVKYNLQSKDYFLATLHRPSNVDSSDNLIKILDVITEHRNGLPIIFPAHPRTKRILDLIGYERQGLIVVDPLPYLEFIFLAKGARAIITDSGGLTEEATVLSVPCLTIRSSTERPETITIGTNVLVGTDPKNLIPLLEDLRVGKWKNSTIPALWDGNAAERILAKLIELYSREVQASEEMSEAI